MSEFKARPYAEIEATRKLAILAGAKIIPKGACHFCAYPIPPKALYCCALCAVEYETERAELAAPQI